MPVRTWMALLMLCSATAFAEQAAATPTAQHTLTTVAQVDSSLQVLDGEQEGWSASPQALDARAHQTAMESFASRRTQLLLQRCRVLGEEGRASLLEVQLQGTQPAQPLPLERQQAMPVREVQR